MGWFSDACDAVGNFISGCCSTVGSALGGLCSGICSLASSIGSFVSGISSSLMASLAPVLSLVASINPVTLVCVVLIVTVLASMLGVNDKDTAPEELGEIAIQHPEIKPENFNSYAEYIEELKKHKEEFNREEFEKKSPMERSAALAVGTGILAKGCAEKLKMDIPMDFYVTMAKGGVEPALVNTLLTSMASKGLKSAGVFQDYINGNKLSEVKTLKMDSVMSEVVAHGGPSVDTILDNIDSGKGIGIYEAALKK